MAFITPLSSQALDATKKAAKASKIANLADTISTAGEIASGIISAVYSVKNEKRRQELAEQIQLLNAQQAAELEARLSKRMSDIDKEQVLAQSLTEMVGKKSSFEITSSITSAYTSQSKSETKTIIYIFLGAIVLIGTIVAIKKLR
jgi:hypothetical protein